MSHRILVVDDEESVREMASDFLSAQGYQVLTAADGDEALNHIQSSRPHLALIDFLLPRKNGFALAEAIRANPESAELPLIMMSGVFKNPKTAVEAREKFQVLDFLSKPLDMNRVIALARQALASVPVDEMPDQLEFEGEQPPEDATSDEGILGAPTQQTGRGAASRKPAGGHRGRPFPAIPGEGHLGSCPVALLLSITRYDQLTGMLDLSGDDGTHRRVYIRGGQPIFMQSTSDGENVGALLLRRGRITEPDYDRCVQYMKAKKRTLQQALLELKLASEQDLATAYKLLAGQLLPSALGMSEGTFKWRETDAFAGRVPEGSFEPLSVLFEGIKRHVHPPQIIRFFRGREDIPLRRTAQFDELLPFFRRAFSANNIANRIDGNGTYRRLSAGTTAEAAQVVPQLYAMVTSGMCVLPEIDADNEVDAVVNSAAAEVEGIGGASFLAQDDDEVEGDSPEEKGAIGRIKKGHDKYMSMNFFEIFGIKASKEVDLGRLKNQYFTLAKQWHTDAYAGLQIGRTARKQVDELFARITEAYETITNPEKRNEYLIFLDREAKGLPTDANQVFKAEAVFDEGVAALRRRDNKGAKAKFAEAVKLNLGQPIFRAHLGWATYLADPKSQDALLDAVKQLKQSLEEQGNLAVAYQFLGQISAATQKEAEAKRWFQKCLELEPGNVEAARGLRLINQRGNTSAERKTGSVATQSPSGREQPGGPGASGLFGRLLKK
ncbi:MAG: response regulator [Deltaproteobacteria bacterium]|nr:response regulator [Deltaproteobacteria bacterium]